MMASRVSKPWWHPYFLSKYNLLKCPNKNKFKGHSILSSEESKIKRVTRHLQCLLQLRSRKHGSFKNRGKKSTNGSTLVKKKTKCFVHLQGISKWEKHTFFLRTATNNFQTDSLKAHEDCEASEGHAMISAAKHASERAREERPLPTLPAALSTLEPKTAVELIKLLLLYIHVCCNSYV